MQGGEQFEPAAAEAGLLAHFPARRRLGRRLALAIARIDKSARQPDRDPADPVPVFPDQFGGFVREQRG